MTTLLGSNETKIAFCNAFNALFDHQKGCVECSDYLWFGDGDLCDQGKTIIASELAWKDTAIGSIDGELVRKL